MKLQEIEKYDIIVETEETIIYVQEINESAIRVIGRNTRGSIIKTGIQSVGSFVKKHPIIAAAVTSYAVDSIKQYKKNKRNTIKFYTKDVEEKKLFKDMSSELMKTGKYRIEKDTVVDGGYLLILKRL